MQTIIFGLGLTILAMLTAEARRLITTGVAAAAASSNTANRSSSQ